MNTKEISDKAKEILAKGNSLKVVAESVAVSMTITTTQLLLMYDFNTLVKEQEGISEQIYGEILEILEEIGGEEYLPDYIPPLKEGIFA